MPGRALPPSHYDDPDDLPRWIAQLRNHAAWHWRDSAGFSTARPENWNKRPALLRALEILARHARADGSTEPWLTFPKLLRSMAITASCLPCLVPVDRALRMPVREPIFINGQVAVPVGTRAWGEVISVKPNGAVGNAGRLAARPLYLDLPQGRVALRDSLREQGRGNEPAWRWR